MDLQPTVDMTGTLSQLDLNTQDISNIMDVINENNDSVSNYLTIAGYNTQTFDSIILTPGQSYTNNIYSFTHNLGYIPAYLVYVPGGVTVGTGPPPNFPPSYSYFTQVAGYYVTTDSNQINYIWYVGVDQVNFYIACNLLNQNVATQSSIAQQFYFYILSNPAVGTQT